MTYTNHAAFGEIIAVAAASISGVSYQAAGSPFSTPVICITFKNDTDGDIFVSTDGVTDMLNFPPNSFGVYDLRTNAPFHSDYMLPEGTQLYLVAGDDSPTSGNFFVEMVIAKQAS